MSAPASRGCTWPAQRTVPAAPLGVGRELPGRCVQRVCPPAQPPLSDSVPSAYGTLTVRSLLDTREHCLNEFNFPDPYSKVSATLLGQAHACGDMGIGAQTARSVSGFGSSPNPSAGDRLCPGATLARIHLLRHQAAPPLNGGLLALILCRLGWGCGERGGGVWQQDWVVEVWDQPPVL